VVGALGVLPTILSFFGGLSVPPPEIAFPDNPLSLLFQITNDNPILPALHISYTCDIENIQFFPAGGIVGPGAFLPALARNPTPILWRKQSMAARCESLFSGNPLFKSAEYSLSVNYILPWPLRRASRCTFIGIIDPRTHHLARWISKTP
jgi:hypothetical protein